MALLAIAGWILDWRILARLGSEYIPMAPSTALAFLLLGGAVALRGIEQAQWARRCFMLAAGILVSLLAAFVLAQAVTGVELGLEGWLTGTAEIFGRFPIGRMSPISAANFLVAGLALLALVASPERWGWAHDVAGSLAGGVVAVGLLVLLGYAYGTPLLYGVTIIPVALPTAIAFVTLGVALLIAAGPHAGILRSYRATALGLMAGVVASVLVFAIVDKLESARIESEFRRRASAFGITLRLVIDDILEDVSEFDGLFASAREVDRSQFRTFAAKSVARIRGLRALSWNPRVASALRPAYEAAARRDGFPSFHFTEDDASGAHVEAARRGEYVVAYYIEPYAGNESELGFDLASDPVRREALERARDRGEMVATGPIASVRGAGTQAEILAFLPLYELDAPAGSVPERRRALRGFAGARIRVGDLVEASLRGMDREGMEVILQDVTAGAGQEVLYAIAGTARPRHGGVSWSDTVDVAGRQWLFEIRSTPWYFAAQQTWLPWGVLGTGLLLTVVLAGYLLTSARHTAEIRKAEQALAERNLQLEAVRAVMGEITRELDLPTLLGLITERSVQLVGGSSGTVFLWDEATQLLIPQAWHGFGDWQRTIRRRLGEGVAGTVALRRVGMTVNNYRLSPYVHSEAMEVTEITAVLGEPLLYRNRLLGVLTVDVQGAGQSFSQQDRETLALFADHAAIAMENARLYAEIRTHASTLAERVKERTHQLEEARDQAEAASQAKSDFLANMSHELRTPLNAVIGFAELLRDQRMGPLNEKQGRFIGHIHESGKHLLEQFNDILDLSRLEAGKLVLRPEVMTVADTLEDVLVIVWGLANKKGQSIESDIEERMARLHADPVRFKQILFNVLSNAVKFTPNGGTITVRAYQQAAGSRQGPAGSGQQAAGSRQEAVTAEASHLPAATCPLPALVIEVTDTGIGIRSEDMSCLFQEFVQLEATATKHHEGTGLGLALTKRLVELHGGRIWATSQGEGCGSTFTVLLPFGGPSETREAPPPAAAG